MITKPILIMKKGQVTIPKKIRDILNSDMVYFEVVKDMVIVKPFKSAHGALKSKKKIKKPFNELREKAWEVVIHEKESKPA